MSHRERAQSYTRTLQIVYHPKQLPTRILQLYTDLSLTAFASSVINKITIFLLVDFQTFNIRSATVPSLISEIKFAK